MKIKRIETLDDVLRLFNIDKSKIVVDKAYLEESKEPLPWATHKKKRNHLIAGTYEDKWIDVLEDDDFFILCYDGIKRSQQIDKATGQISEFKIVVA